jgi:hypothetical protein
MSFSLDFFNPISEKWENKALSQMWSGDARSCYTSYVVREYHMSYRWNIYAGTNGGLLKIASNVRESVKSFANLPLTQAPTLPPTSSPTTQFYDSYFSIYPGDELISNYFNDQNGDYYYGYLKSTNQTTNQLKLYVDCGATSQSDSDDDVNWILNVYDSENFDDGVRISIPRITPSDCSSYYRWRISFARKNNADIQNGQRFLFRNNFDPSVSFSKSDMCVAEFDFHVLLKNYFGSLSLLIRQW